MKKSKFILWGMILSFTFTEFGYANESLTNSTIQQQELGLNIFKKKKKSRKKDSAAKNDTTKTKNEYSKIVGPGTITQEGMFRIHKKKNDYYFEIPANLLNRDMLIVNKLRKVPAAINRSGINKGINYQIELVRFEWNKDENRILVREVQPKPQYPEGDAIGKSVEEITVEHWKKYGRVYYMRFDFEGLETQTADKLMSDLEEKLASLQGKKYQDYEVSNAAPFVYHDPVDGSSTKNGLVVDFTDGSKITYRLSGTGSSGATLRMYVESPDSKDFNQETFKKLQPLMNIGMEIAEITKRTGKTKADVNT